jgi:hypothetical protein
MIKHNLGQLQSIHKHNVRATPIIKINKKKQVLHAI